MFVRACIRPIVAALALAGFGVCGAQAHKPKNIEVLESICQKTPCGTNISDRMTPDGSGNFFGFMQRDGVNGGGTAFKLYREPGKAKWKFQEIYNFCSLQNCLDGIAPDSEAPVIDSAGNLYGATADGGTHGQGIFFKLTPNWNGRQWKLTVLYNFCSKDSACHDGGEPFGTLTYQGASSGALYDGVSPLYGTNEFGGPHGGGGAYSLTPRFGRWHEQVIYPFCAGTTCTERPAFGLSVESSGNLLGVVGGGSGFVFRLTPNPGSRFWTQTILYNFCQLPACADGAFPGSAVEDASGNIYGIAGGGSNTGCGEQNGCGVIYKIAPDNSETVLYAFCARRKCSDGFLPVGELTLDPSGDLYGVTDAGGDDTANPGFGSGTVFKLSGTTLHTMWTFCQTTGCPDGEFPVGGVATDASGNLYGVTLNGGTEHDGTVYKLNQRVPFDPLAKQP